MQHLSRLFTWGALLCAAVFLTPPDASAQVDARLLRHPDVSASHVTFVYGGDVWVVPKEGGTAQRLSSPDGTESFPRFSPDGETIAFSANYDGNTDVYTLSRTGGVPTRITYHPESERVLDWTPAGDSLLFASSMKSPRNRFDQLYTVAAAGGLPHRLSLQYGEFGTFSGDGTKLAFTPETRLFSTWKRYRGGAAADVWIYDRASGEAQNVTQHDANDEMPMWHGSTVYFLSDRGPNVRYNLWAMDVDTGEARQVTRFSEVDVHFPSIGPSEIVFEADGSLHLMDLETEETRRIDVDVISDRRTVKPRTESAAQNVQSAFVSPGGERAVLSARGELFSLPAKHGVVRSLTRTSGSAERFPAWSPDGETLAFFSDATGEYELTLMNADGSGERRTVSEFGPGFRYQPHWSPDSDRIAFIDDAMTLRIFDVESEAFTTVEQFPQWMNNYRLTTFDVDWSPDGRWLAYTKTVENDNDAVILYDTEARETHQVTSAFYSTQQAIFSASGDYLFLTTDRNFAPVYGDHDSDFVYPNATEIAVIPLRKDVPSPLHPRNDEVASEEDGENGDDEGEASEDETVEIDLDGFEQRTVVLPVEPGRFPEIAAADGMLIFHHAPRTGSGDEAAPIKAWDFEAREEKTILDDADGFQLSADRKKLLVVNNQQYGIVDAAPGQSMTDMLPTDEMEVTVNPREEWQQMFADAWRFQRDLFYDPTLHGVDWEAKREQYGAMLEDAVTRSDVNFVIGELIGELDASHTYRYGGDALEDPDRRSVGLLGVDWALENGAYRIARIVDGAPWDVETRSPLHEPGVDVREGDYVLAVNGEPIDTEAAPWAAFQGMAGKTVELTVNDAPTTDDARTVLVELSGWSDEQQLRYHDWIDQNRQRVEDASGGRVGYVYVPNTGIDGQTELLRQWRAQVNKDALIIDERFNSGGQIPDRFIELLNRTPTAFWAVRHGEGFQTPSVAHFGPKAMLANGWSGSGGDAFPDYFQKADLGPVIGTRTWGGLIGISGTPPLVDGGGVTVPTFRMYNPDGTWFAEGRGVIPDIRVTNDPAAVARGTDAQLSRAVEEMLNALQTTEEPRPPVPQYESRTASSD